MAYGLNAMVYNTSWITAYFHLIFGGSVLIIYFAIVYEIWPRLTGSEHASAAPPRLVWMAGAKTKKMSRLTALPYTSRQAHDAEGCLGRLAAPCGDARA